MEQRVISRVAYQETKRQANIENIAGQAAEELSRIDSVASEKPGSDWTARFFRIAEDINTEHMQLLWGKVLAGEIKKPGSYSLRTLDLLRNITQEEAELFVKVARLAIDTGQNSAFVPNFNSGEYLKEKYGLRFEHLLLLRELGLLFSNDVGYTLTEQNHDYTATFTNGSTCILVDWPKGTPSNELTGTRFTKFGSELLKLVDKAPADADYIEKFASHYRREGVVIRAAPIIQWFDKGYEIDESAMKDYSKATA